MSVALFPYPPDEVAAGMRAHHAREDAEVFVAEREDGTLCGFVEVGERSYADGCESTPVAYIEALYVDPDMRRRGIARSLLAAAEAWGLSRGRSEIASDALLDNDASHAVHTNAGYEETDRVVQFRKRLR